MPELSIIVIGRNEAGRIAMCLRALFAALAGESDYEVIYVDSASEDNTVEIASRFPIRILQLRREWPLTPAAGRFVGYRHSTGKYVMFVDGDTLLYKRWPQTAVAFLHEHPEFGGIAGIMHQAYHAQDGHCIAVAKNHFAQSPAQPLQTATALGGIALYRRDAMEKAGTFNPFLSTGEECEVALRIERAGYRLGRIYAPMCVTYSMPRESVVEIMRRSRSRLYDYGTTLRYCLANGTGLRFSVTQMSFVFSFMALILLSVLVLGLAAWTGTEWLVAAAFAIGGVYLAVKRKQPRALAISLLKRSMMTYRTVWSFFNTKLLPADAYPTDIVVVQ